MVRWTNIHLFDNLIWEWSHEGLCKDTSDDRKQLQMWCTFMQFYMEIQGKNLSYMESALVIQFSGASRSIGEHCIGAGVFV